MPQVISAKDTNTRDFQLFCETVMTEVDVGKRPKLPICTRTPETPVQVSFCIAIPVEIKDLSAQHRRICTVSVGSHQNLLWHHPACKQGISMNRYAALTSMIYCMHTFWYNSAFYHLVLLCPFLYWRLLLDRVRCHLKWPRGKRLPKCRPNILCSKGELSQWINFCVC